MSLSKRAWNLIAILFFALAPIACSSAYYSFWEKLGKEKRDLLRDNVESVRDDQQAVAKQLQSALARLKESYGTGGGAAEDMYEAVKSDYERSESRSATLKARIRKVESIGSDLFQEWEREIDEISSADLRHKSQTKLTRTQAKFEGLRQQMRRAEEAVDPVLAKLRDQMLFLKHNLNSQALGRLEQTEVAEIERDMRDLIREIDTSVRRADEFIGTLGD